MSQGAEPSDGVSGRCHRHWEERSTRGLDAPTRGSVPCMAVTQPAGGRATHKDTPVMAEEEEEPGEPGAHLEGSSHTPRFQLQSLGSQMRNQKLRGQGPTSRLRRLPSIVVLTHGLGCGRHLASVVQPAHLH